MKEESNLLPVDWSIPVQLRGRLGTTAGRQRVLEEDGHLLLVLHAPPGADETDRRGRFFRDPGGNWRQAPKAERVATIDDHLNEYRVAIEQLEQAEGIARMARDYFELLDRLTPLVRATRNMYETLQQARDTVRDDRNLIVARDQAYDLTRRADLLHDDAKNALDFAVAWQSEQQAETSYQMSVATHRLNLLVAFFFPIATLTAVLRKLAARPRRMGPPERPASANSDDRRRIAVRRHTHRLHRPTRPAAAARYSQQFIQFT